VAVPFLVTDIQERVRVRCGLPTFTANTNITIDMILSMVQESARDLSGLLNEMDWYFVDNEPLTTTASVHSVSLPSNFAQLLRLTWTRDANWIYDVPLANLEQVPAASVLNWENCPPSYRLVGDALWFYPVPTAAYNLDMLYSTGAFLADASATLMGQVGWDTWIVYNCCCIVKQRQDEEYGAFAQERASKLLEIRGQRRDHAGVKQPRDVRYSGRGMWPSWQWWRGS
jgi:hypothetical protein